MIATKKYISTLLKERRDYINIFGIQSGCKVWNWLISHHIKGFKNNKHTILNKNLPFGICAKSTKPA